MKKEILLILIILMIFLPIISAPDIILSKGSYSPRETLQAEITGNFLSLKSENILIYQGDKVHSEPVIKELTKQDNIYYFYALLPNSESNFSLRIQNTQYIESGKLKSDDLIKNFTIILSNESVLAIDKGFIVTNKDFSIIINALNKNQKISAVLEESGESKNFSLIEETQKSLVFSISNIKSRKTFLNINNYKIPVFITKKQSEIETGGNLEFVPSTLFGTISSEQDYVFKIILRNSGNKTLSNIRLSNNFNAEISPNIIDSIVSGNNSYIELKIKKSKEKIIGDIIAEYNNKTIRVPVAFDLTINNSNVNIINAGITETDTLSCNAIGLICTEIQSCSGEIASSLEGACCKGQCIEKTTSSINYNWIYGLILIALLLIIVAWFVIKIKKKRRFETSELILKQRTSRYSRRMNPSEEVNGKLDKI
jgi:hypothetical protein